MIENHTTQIQVDRDNQGQSFSLKDIGKNPRSIFKPSPLRWHLRNPQQHENYFRKGFCVRPPPRTSPAAEPAKRAEPVPRLHRQLPRHQYPLVSVLHATQGVALDQISRDCTPNHYYALNSQLSSSQYNNQQQFISNYFPVHKPKSRRIRSAQPSHITGDNLVKIALNPSQPDSRIPTIFVSNIRSIAPKIDELECVVNQNDSDIVCITETWLSDEIPDNAIAMHGFSLFRKDREKRGGGVAIFVKSNIQCKRLSVPDIPESVTEILWLQMRPCRLPRAVSSILIAVVYHPPHASADDNYKVYNHIQGVVDSHLACHPDSLICIVGDFNPNSTNISSSRFRQLCGLAQIVKVFTRDSGILDWCLTNKPKIMSVPEKLPKIGSSDHYCFVVRQKLPRAKPPPKETIFRRDTRDSRIREFGQWITSFSWQEVLSKGSCQDKFECFHRTLLGAVEKYLPMKTVNAAPTSLG